MEETANAEEATMTVPLLPLLTASVLLGVARNSRTNRYNKPDLLHQVPFCAM